MKTILTLAALISGAVALTAHEGHSHGGPKASGAPKGSLPLRATQAVAKKADVDAQIAALTARAESRPDEDGRWVALGNALMQKSRDSMDASLWAKAEVAYQRALDRNPKNAEALVGMAWVHNSEHEFEAGIRFARQAIEINPGLHNAHLLISDAAVELGDYDRALDSIQSALDVRPDLASLSRAAHVLWLTGDAVKARLLMQKAIASGGPYPENTAWCRAQHAAMLFDTGALLPAAQEAARAVEQAPGNPLVLAIAGRIAAAKGDIQQAVMLCRRSVDAQRTHEGIAGLIAALEQAGEVTEAQTWIQKLIRFHREEGAGHGHAHSEAEAGTHVHGSAQLARFLADRDLELDAALAEARAAYRDFPNVFAADTLAWCLYKKGDIAEARKLSGKALKHRTPNADLHFHAGMILAKAGDSTAARKHFHTALSLNPRFHHLFAEVAATRLAEMGGVETAAAK
jgi:tetratricopeptide (TPR) repeat protein